MNMRALIALLGIFLVADFGRAGSVERGLFPKFDAHVHAFYGGSIEENAQQFNQIIEELGLENLFVLSDAYHENQFVGPEEQDPRRVQNQFASDVLDQIHHPVIGLCGYKPTWEDGVSVLEECLQGQKMKGLKVRAFGDTYYLQTPTVERNFRSVLSTYQDKIRYVLFHMPIDSPEALLYAPDDTALLNARLEHDSREVETFVKMALDFPKTQFVVGHSFYSTEMVLYAKSYRTELERRFASQLTAQNRQTIDNLWIETSTAIKNFLPIESSALEAEARRDAFIQAWREFGIERILFGSDLVLGGPTSKVEFRSADQFYRETEVLTGSGLSDEELYLIFELNWRRMIDENQ